MKKFISIILSVLIVFNILTLLPVNVYADQTGDFEYYVVEYADFSLAMISGYHGTASDVIIPDTLGGYVVTSIASNSFDGCKTLKTIVVPDAVYGISDYAFNNCSGLTKITLSKSLFDLGKMAFNGCFNMLEFEVPATNTRFQSDSGVLFSKDKLTLLQFPKGKTGPYTVPSGVATIADYSFYQCNGIKEVFIASSVSSVGNNAFRASSLTKANIPGNVTSIGEFAYAFSTKLLEVYIDSGVSFIGKYAFNSCTSMRAAVFNGFPPSTGPGAFSRASKDFKIYCQGASAGFSNPWKGYITTTAVYIPPTPTPTPIITPTPLPTLTPPTINTITNIDKYITGKAAAGGKITVSVAGKTIYSAASKGVWGVILSSTLIAGTKIVAQITMPDKTTSSRTIFVKPATPKVNTIKANSILVTGSATKNSVVYVKIGTKQYNSTANSKTGAYSIKTAKIIKGTLVTVYCKAGGQLSSSKIVKAI
ncbi:MAG: leucine-rich repeat domain-containing protein [Bacillota bacterium]